jgi:hypothetical protein
MEEAARMCKAPLPAPDIWIQYNNTAQHSSSRFYVNRYDFARQSRRYGAHVVLLDHPTPFVINGQSTPEAFNVFVSYISGSPVSVPAMIENDVARLASELGCTSLELQVQGCKKETLPNASNHDVIASRLPDLLQSNPELFANIPIDDIDKILTSSARPRNDPLAENLAFDLI